MAPALPIASARVELVAVRRLKSVSPNVAPSPEAAADQIDANGAAVLKEPRSCAQPDTPTAKRSGADLVPSHLSGAHTAVSPVQPQCQGAARSRDFRRGVVRVPRRRTGDGCSTTLPPPVATALIVDASWSGSVRGHVDRALLGRKYEQNCQRRGEHMGPWVLGFNVPSLFGVRERAGICIWCSHRR